MKKISPLFLLLGIFMTCSISLYPADRKKPKQKHTSNPPSADEKLLRKSYPKTEYPVTRHHLNGKILTRSKLNLSDPTIEGHGIFVNINSQSEVKNNHIYFDRLKHAKNLLDKNKNIVNNADRKH